MSPFATVLAALAAAASASACPDGLVSQQKLAGLPSALSAEWPKFCDFVARYGKEYGSEAEVMVRLGNFVASLEEAASLQAQANLDNASVVYGATKFSDLSREEFVAFAAPGKGAHGKPGGGTPDYPNTYVRAPPKGFLPPPFMDWRSKAGVVSAVKDQGQCGGCWAFSATEEVESMSVLAGMSPTEYSVQEVVSCDRKDNWHCPDDDDCKNVDAGCDGGDPVFGILFICNKTKGLATESQYPYASGKKGKTGKCNAPAKKVTLPCTGFSWGNTPCDKGNCAGQDEATLQANLAAWGPAAISVDAGGAGWQHYKSGIMPKSGCKSSAAGKLDHAVQLVGYSTDGSGSNYWTVRNSWNTDWGEKGYIRFSMGNNACGLADQPVFADFPAAPPQQY